MKTLFFALFLSACSSHHHEPNPVEAAKIAADAAEYKLQAGESYAKVEKGLGAPESCVEIHSSKYCRWKAKGVLVFKDGLYLAIIPVPSNPLTYAVQVEAETSEKKFGPMQAVPGGKKLKAQSLEWRKHSSQIMRFLKGTGLVIETSQKTDD